MINRQILDYIKLEQQKGTSREIITSSLLTNGWNNDDVKEAYDSLAPLNIKPQSPNPVSSKENLWIKTIPRLNVTFLIIYSLLLLLVDLPTYLGNKGRYEEFWFLMLAVFGGFVLFFFLENYVFKKSFEKAPTTSDKGILTVITIRNIMVLLNVIPLIQLLGMLAGLYLGWIIMLIYIVMIIMRYSETKKSSITGQMTS